MNITIAFDTDFSAFQNNPQEKLLVIDRAKELIESGRTYAPLRDSFGMEVGYVEVLKD